jgi:uncharacterized protein
MFSRSPLSSPDASLANVQILINGATADDLLPDLLRIEVTEDLEAISMVTIHLDTPVLFTEKHKWIDDRRFDIGNSIEIQMGYSNRPRSLIIGEITGLEPEFSQSQGSSLVIRGHDLRHRLLRGRKTESFIKMKDSAIVRKIASNNGLSAIVTETSIIHDYVIQHNQTDLEFLQSRAQRLGYEVWVERKNVHFRPSQHEKSKVLTLSFFDELLEFVPRLSTLTQVSEVEVRGWNMREKSSIVSTSKDNAFTSMGGKTSGSKAVKKAFGTARQVIIDRPVSTVDEAQQIAASQVTQLALEYITGEGQCRGQPSLRSGSGINIKDVGERFSGLYYVTSVIHTWTQAAGYLTEFNVRRTAT